MNTQNPTKRPSPDKGEPLPQKRKSPRGCVRKADAVLITAWVPESLSEAIAAAVTKMDTDRSKFMRRAIRHELERIA